MIDLDDLTKISALDKRNAFDSIQQLPQQIQQAWNESFAIDFPQDFKNISNIVVAGMGGSTYGARIVKSLYDGAQMTKVPVELSNNYCLPGYVNNKTLVILSSYSGTTEETLVCAKQAKERGAKITGITSGGKLAEFLKGNNYPAYIFDPIHNPSAQPRIGVGYMVTGLIGILSKLGFIPVGNSEITKIVSDLNEFDSEPLKEIAQRLIDKIPVIIVADFLEGAAYAIRNPFHETAKQFALYFAIPELNHHLLEGLSYPSEIKKFLYFIFIKSAIYDKRNAERLELTADVVKQNKVPFETVVLGGYSALTQVFELIAWGAWLTFYLAMLHEVDPSEIPWVDYFKKKLTR